MSNLDDALAHFKAASITVDQWCAKVDAKQPYDYKSTEIYKGMKSLEAAAHETPEPPPPPPPPPPNGATGKLFHRIASNYSDTHADQNLERWTYVDMQGINAKYTSAIRAAKVIAALYKNNRQIGGFGQTYPGSDLRAVYGVGPGEATAEMKTNMGWNTGVLAAVGNPAYQNLWISNTLKAVQAGGFNGVFIDDVHAWSWYGYPSIYPDETSYRNATFSFLQAMYPKFKAAGVNVICNIGSSPSADKFKPYITSWLQYMDGLMDEGVGRNNTSHNGTRDGPVWVANRLALIKQCQAAGKMFVGEIPADDGDTATIAYGIAHLLIAKDYSSDAATVGVAGSPEGDGAHYGHQVWTPLHDKALALGQPTAPAAYSGGIWGRPFERGSVRLDTNTTTATF